MLQPIVDEVFVECGEIPVLQRNTLQSDRGGFDIVGLETLAIEVKNCQTFQLEKWWKQAEKQTKRGQIAVLIYKKNHVPFRVRMHGGVGFTEAWITCVCDISIEDFLKWFREHLERTL